MLFNNLMEDKRSNLNLNQPLLSVRTRRNSSPSLYTQKDEKRKTSNSLPIVPRPPPYRSELQSGPIRNPGAVPFLWEHIPGQPKEDINPHSQNHNKPPIVPKLPPCRYIKANETMNISRDSDGRVKNIESMKDATEEIESSNSEDTDEAYVDALDTLSRTESHFINCSMSGLSGIDDLDTKPSGSLKDPKTQDFMMNRFLPAAKAMVIETPHTAPKKQPVVQERTQVKKIDNQVKPSLRYGPSFAKRYSHYNNDDEEEASDDEYDRRGNLPSVCGLLPRFCLKGSVCILNPVPVMSVRTRVSMSPASKIKPRSSSPGSYSTSENESKSDISELQSIDKSRAAEFEEKTSLRNESGQSENASTYCDAPPVPCAKEVCWFPEEKKHVDEVFESDGNCIKTFQDFLADPEELDSGGVALEKTVYVDTIHKVESPKSLRSPRLSGDDSKLSAKIMDQIHVKDLKKINSLNGEVKPLVNAHEFGDFQKLGMEMQKSFGEDKDINFASTVTENKKDSTRSLEKKKMSEYLVPPPLPKSPSDSWLGRTLPSMSAKKCSFLGATTYQLSKASTGDSKWEAIVKTTNVQRQHLRYSEEHLTPIPET